MTDEDHASRRTADFLQVLIAVAQGDYRARCRISGAGDDFDAIAVGMNMTIDELEHSVGALERAYRELQDRSESLTRAHSELQEVTAQVVQSEKLAALGELAAGVAHEVNQPLNGIKIISQSILRDLRDGALDLAELPLDLGEIIALVDRMAGVVDHMRVFTRRTDPGNLDVLDLGIVTRSAVRLHRRHLESQGIELQESYAEDLAPVRGNAIRLEQVLVNLTVNAFHALESVRDRPKVIAVRVTNRPEQRAVVVEVEDNGPGIPEPIRGKVFQPFFTTREPGSGTGLGLSVSLKIVEQHGGRIELETVPGKGTLFRLVLPAIAADDAGG